MIIFSVRLNEREYCSYVPTYSEKDINSMLCELHEERDMRHFIVREFKIICDKIRNNSELDCVFVCPRTMRKIIKTFLTLDKRDRKELIEFWKVLENVETPVIYVSSSD